MSRGPVPKAVKDVERFAVILWDCGQFTYGENVPAEIWRDRESQIFGAGQILRLMGQDRAANDAFFLASLAGHLALGGMPLPSQSDFATVEGGGWLNGCRSL